MSDFAYPREVVRILKFQALNLKHIVGVHFKKRHQYGNQPTRNWIAEYRRFDASSGYSKALAQINKGE